MLIRLVILVTTLAWLIASLPQSRFLWTATNHLPGTFDYNMGMIRAVIIDLLPLFLVFLESELEKAHLKKAKRSYDRKGDEWKEATDFDHWAQTKYPTPEQAIKKRLPLLFGLVTFVIAVSYISYYGEFGKDLIIYQTVWGRYKVGAVIKVVVYSIYLSIAALVTYTFGRLSSAMEVHLIFSDIGKVLFSKSKPKKVAASEPKPKPKKSRREIAKERRVKILGLLQENVDQDVIKLAKRFEVSDQTIRNDYIYLANAGKIIYTQGKVLLEEEGDF